MTIGGGGGRIVPGPDYRLGPGDLLEVQIVGRVDVTRQQLFIDPVGLINVPPLGSIRIGGFNLLDAQHRITEQARRLFRYVDLTVALITARCFPVTVSGEVERPGTIQVAATRRVHEVVLNLGGITPRGSLRRVRVMKDGTEREADFLRFELTADLGHNPVVEEGMRIVVPPRGPSVTLGGAVRRPGEYEIGSDGSLAGLLRLIGGLSPIAVPTQARLTRVGADDRKETVFLNLQTALAPPADVQLRANDALYVPPLTFLQDVIEVRGAFNGIPESGRTTMDGKPTIVQRFELAQGDRVRDIVVRAGGPAAFADLRLAMIDRGAVTGPRQRIPVDLFKLLVEHDETQNILLENSDVFTLSIQEDKVYVLGEVRRPGAVDFRPELTTREYVALAGGPAVRANLPKALVTFRNGVTYPFAEAPPLEAGAVVTIPEVSVKWWQDYVMISNVVIGLITAYTGLYLLFGGRVSNVLGTTRD